MESHEKDLRSAVESEELRKAIQNDYRAAGLAAREVALLDYAVKLTRNPQGVSRADLDALRKVGYADEQLVDVVQCISYFNFINRVLDGLGVDPEPGMRYAEPAVEPTGSDQLSVRTGAMAGRSEGAAAPRFHADAR